MCFSQKVYLKCLKIASIASHSLESLIMQMCFIRNIELLSMSPASLKSQFAVYVQGMFQASTSHLDLS